MSRDDSEPTTKKVEVKNLEIMSIEALREYIFFLQAEIKRVKLEIELKKEARKGAEGIFK
ncbi:MAG: DUF1192 domain-containing protein [Rhodospirillales bacterium]|jgi:uncharacterized small protein (DUF1192 family)